LSRIPGTATSSRRRPPSSIRSRRGSANGHLRRARRRIDGSDSTDPRRAERSLDFVATGQRRFPAPISIGVDHILYVMMDGDQVGRRIEDLLLRNSLPRLYLLIQDLNEAVLVLSRAFRAAKGR